MSLLRLLRSLFKILREKFATVNLFDSRSDDRTTVRREILSTRLFIFLLATSVVILIVYAFTTVQVKSETIKLPTQSVYEHLQKKYADTLQCPCRKISISYGRFVNVVPLFHQVCSSDFVSQFWIDFTFEINTTLIWPIDVRKSLSAMWQMIGVLCQTATNTTLNVLEQFANSSLIHSMILSETLLKTKTEATVNLLHRISSATLIRPLTLVHRIAQANELVTALSTNYIAVTEKFGLAETTVTVNDELLYVGMFENRYVFNKTTTPCTCKNNGSCPIPANLYLYDAFEKYGFYDLNTMEANATLSGIVIDCFPLKTTLASSLECFYNQSCLNILLSGYQKTINVSILDQYKSSRFLLTTPIEPLLNELFIEKIVTETMFHKYYLECAPIYCHYIDSRRFDLIYVITILVALFGGLNTVLRLITPYLVNLIFFLKHRRFVARESESQTTQTRLRNFISYIKNTMEELNMFSNHSRDLSRVRHGRIASRLYIILFTVFISVLIVYTSLSVQTISQTVASPTQEQYEKLLKQYSQTLQCPCTTISIPYEDFLRVAPIYHQVCSSDFIQSWWYQSLLPLNVSDLSLEFLPSVSSYFQTLSAFCEIANLTIVDAIRQFSLTLFVNAQVLPYDLFVLQTNSLITIFLNLTRADFRHTMSLLNAVFQANQYVSSMMTNTWLGKYYIPEFELSELGPIRISSTSMGAEDQNGNFCDCVLDSTCNLDNMVQINILTNNFYSELPGIHPGCFIVNTVLRSSLICWYNNSCINKLQSLLNEAGMRNILHINALDPHLSSRYTPDTLTNTIFNEIMVEQWNSSISYRNFYQKCHPAYCSYTYEKRSDVIYIITTLLGLFGGLNIILRLISPFASSIFFQFINVKTTSKSSLQAWTNEEETHQNRHMCFDLLNQFRQKLVLLNLFDSESTEQDTIQCERLSTRLYLLLLLICIGCVTMYICLSTETSSITISYPFQIQYEELLRSYSKTLQCPCSQISIPYKEFITINTTFHQVCLSDFVKDIWRQCIFGDQEWYYRNRADLRTCGVAYFVFLSNLCTLSQTTVINAINEFLADTFISAQMMPELEFRLQIGAAFHQFKTMTSEKFSRILTLIYETIERSAFVSSYSFNWFWWLKYNSSVATIPTQAVKLEDGCSCGTRSDCVQMGGFYLPFTTTLDFAIPGWNVACSPVETLLRSTLECFYNQTCVDLVLYYATIEFIDQNSLHAI
ncbi:unnamed protein product, partial [Rotaria sp. Silwood1]